MTTDITNVQNAFMMVIRVAVRAPLTFIFSYIMCLIISPKLSLMFLIAVISVSYTHLPLPNWLPPAAT